MRRAAQNVEGARVIDVFEALSVDLQNLVAALQANLLGLRFLFNLRDEHEFAIRTANNIKGQHLVAIRPR